MCALLGAYWTFHLGFCLYFKLLENLVECFFWGKELFTEGSSDRERTISIRPLSVGYGKETNGYCCWSLRQGLLCSPGWP
jgi:hypothetical protein